MPRIIKGILLTLSISGLLIFAKIFIPQTQIFAIATELSAYFAFVGLAVGWVSQIVVGFREDRKQELLEITNRIRDLEEDLRILNNKLTAHTDSYGHPEISKDLAKLKELVIQLQVEFRIQYQKD